MAKFRLEKEISITKGEDMCPNPIMRFEDGNFPDYVMTEIVRAGFTAPTAIQSQGFSIRYEDTWISEE